MYINKMSLMSVKLIIRKFLFCEKIGISAIFPKNSVFLLLIAIPRYFLINLFYTIIFISPVKIILLHWHTPPHIVITHF